MNTTLTQKGQVTIPAPIRKRLKLKTSDKVTFYVENGDVKVKKAKDFLSLQGAIDSDKAFNLKDMRKAAKKHLANDHGKLN